MLDDTTFVFEETDLTVSRIGSLPIAPMPMRKQSLFGEDTLQPGLISRLLFLFSPRTGH